jgi:hypothetical protein
MALINDQQKNTSIGGLTAIGSRNDLFGAGVINRALHGTQHMNLMKPILTILIIFSVLQIVD